MFVCTRVSPSAFQTIVPGVGFTPTGKETLGHLPWEGGGSGISSQDHLGPSTFCHSGEAVQSTAIGKTA